jgi:cytidyltransferase-like protein
MIFMGGSFNPIHPGHIEAMNSAKKEMEKKGYRVVGGYLAVATDQWVMKKNRDQAIPARHRINMCQVAVSEKDSSRWIKVGPEPVWSALKLAQTIINPSSNIKTVIVCGEDKLNPSERKKSAVISVCVSRSSASHGGMLAAVKPGLSSTQIRDKLIQNQYNSAIESLTSSGYINESVGTYIKNNISDLSRQVPYLFRQ